MIYGPYILDYRRYYIFINSDLSPSFIQVFVLHKGKGTHYRYAISQPELRKLIGVINEGSGKGFIKTFITDKDPKLYTSIEGYLGLLAPTLIEKMIAHLKELGVHEEDLQAWIHVNKRDDHSITKGLHDFYHPIASRIISPEHPLILFQQGDETELPRLRDDGTIIIPNPYPIGRSNFIYAKLKDYGSVEAYRKHWGWKGDVWDPDPKFAEDRLFRSGFFEEGSGFENYLSYMGFTPDEYAKELRLEPPDTQYEVFYHLGPPRPKPKLMAYLIDDFDFFAKFGETKAQWFAKSQKLAKEKGFTTPSANLEEWEYIQIAPLKYVRVRKKSGTWGMQAWRHIMTDYVIPDYSRLTNGTPEPWHIENGKRRPIGNENELVPYIFE